MATEKNNVIDVTVVGGGLAGLVQALSLARAGFSVLLVEAQPLPDMKAKQYDLRTTALSAASQAILNNLGLWSGLALRACAIQDIRIADGDARGFLHFAAHEVGADAFGWIIENHQLRAHLLTALAHEKTVCIIAPATVVDLHQRAMHMDVKLSGGEVIASRLVVAADGRKSFVREWAGIGVRRHDYATSAVVCNLRHAQDHHHHAIEHFMPGGPFAILPMRKSGKYFQSALVWSEAPERAKALVEMDEKDFNALLFHHMPHYGKIAVHGSRRAYPLSLQHAAAYHAPRIALISETVHAMHPIAGQGLNVGMRDVATLTSLLTDARRLGLDIGSQTLLARYGAMRWPDSLAMSAATHLLDGLFSNHYATAAGLRRAGLQIVSKMPPLKRFFMRYAMGLTHRPTHRIAA